MKRMNFPLRRLKRRKEAEERNAFTPIHLRKSYRRLKLARKAQEAK